jgi:phosphinothricin acetyltransferase
MAVIRLATAADAKGILDIYAPYISNTSYTFETEIPSLESFQERIRTYTQNWPWLVCEINGVIAGYAYAAAYRERVAYQWCVESSIYIHDDFQRSRVGTALYMALFDILKTQGFRTVYAVININLPNEKSVAFHEKFGFEYIATYRNVGYKLGNWKNVGWWQLVINEYDHEPAPPVKFMNSNKDMVESLLRLAGEKLGQ